MTSSQIRFGILGSAAAGIGALALCFPAASEGRPRGDDAGAMQVLADVVLIETQCGQVTVDYGKLFAFAERNGISAVDIMPAGDRRAAFAAAHARRARETRADHLCGDLAADRAAAIPGVFTPR